MWMTQPMCAHADVALLLGAYVKNVICPRKKKYYLCVTYPFHPSLCVAGVCLLIVVLMYVMWVHVLDTLEEFARGQQVSGCKSFHLSIQHGPSFHLAPVASFFSLLSGLLFLVIAHGVRSLEPHRTHKTPDPPELQTDL